MHLGNQELLSGLKREYVSTNPTRCREQHVQDWFLVGIFVHLPDEMIPDGGILKMGQA